MKPGRIPCEVPFCRRTAKRENYESPNVRIICGKHWRLGDARPRRVWNRAMRRWRRHRDERALSIAWRCWERVLKQAIERSAGVTA